MVAAAFPSAASARNHWCRGGDPPIYASGRTSCGFAEGIASAWYSTCGGQGTCVRRVRSPVTHRRYRITCYFGDLVTCSGVNGIRASFSGNAG